MYEPDPELLAGESAEDEAEDSIMSPIPVGPPSPFPPGEDLTPKEGSPYEAPVYIPEDIPIPPDFELRESSIPGAGLGVWAKKKVEMGEQLGPCSAAPRAPLKEASFGWEVSLHRTWPAEGPRASQAARPCRLPRRVWCATPARATAGPPGGGWSAPAVASVGACWGCWSPVGRGGAPVRGALPGDPGAATRVAEPQSLGALQGAGGSPGDAPRLSEAGWLRGGPGTCRCDSSGPALWGDRSSVGSPGAPPAPHGLGRRVPETRPAQLPCGPGHRSSPGPCRPTAPWCPAAGRSS
ncbi:Histone-lysine N-methyltransferase PRDM16 [Galemys pyrenaicus]|uniref:Histone-lysine N-methyltransferase PRDM16 n=1 Tax=Galemys pyrenaicus TaxID=202257 RepID=A0A8J5ZH65_GALPY|nr:Histone-lysine N-methyltransferase PRDM16 [Galemys pyrenaicus]